MPPPTASFSKNGKCRNRTASGSGIWRDVVCVELNALLLVWLSRVNVADSDVAVEEFLEHFDMHGRIGADRPVARTCSSRSLFVGPWRRRPPPPITRRGNFPGPQRARRSLRDSSRRPREQVVHCRGMPGAAARSSNATSIERLSDVREAGDARRLDGPNDRRPGQSSPAGRSK
jgi:hypothetical protein